MNNPIFGNYARYYNLLYRDKDYYAEACYIHELIQSQSPGARTVLNLGCGTGNHDFELEKFGYEITGIDLSKEMLAAANDRLNSSHSACSKISFQQGDIRTVRLDKTFDTVISLFHVMSYQTSNDDLVAAIATAKEHLSDNGVFVFDCWYGPAVLNDPPIVRVKRFEDGQFTCVRIAEPVMYPNENIVDVNYQIMFTDTLTGRVEQLFEKHRMRYLFVPEVEFILRMAGLEIIDVSEWMTGTTPDLSSWNVCFRVKR